jgi:hypothetical protein
MAQFIPVSNALKFELKTGELTTSGKDKLTTVSFQNIDPAKAADDLSSLIEMIANCFSLSLNEVFIDKRFSYDDEDSGTSEE